MVIMKKNRRKMKSQFSDLVTNINDKINQRAKQFILKDIQPLTENQKLVFEKYAEGKHLILNGYPGTGKSLIPIYLALKDILTGVDSPYQKLVILRSVVPSRDMGFLPGSAKEKARIYEQPYHDICNEIFDNKNVSKNGYETLKTSGNVSFQTTSFLRGTQFNNCVIFLDEAQNLGFHEINTVLTRVGENCRVIISGDIEQTDLLKEQNGLSDLTEIVKYMDSFYRVEFTIDDILRSSFVKEYIIAKDKWGSNNV
jgi:predicted ribonuclease YlaK